MLVCVLYHHPQRSLKVLEMKRFVTYIRVSTAAQGASGLGLEAQREAVRRAAGDGEIIAEFQEIESGSRNDRPQLAAAIKRCKATRATLLVARLDRLARNLRFITEIMDSGVDLLCADLPSVNRLTLQILGAVAEEERRLISERTKGALAAAKARGVKLGGVREGVDLATHAKAASKKAAQQRSQRANEAAERLRDGATELRQELGADASLHDLAAALTARGFTAPRGGPVSAMTLHRALAA
jgi:DNA invertase Pin-like site-specific DNA recombinase